MSTMAEVIQAHTADWANWETSMADQIYYRCLCGQVEWHVNSSTDYHQAHAAHVAEELAKAGFERSVMSELPEAAVEAAAKAIEAQEKFGTVPRSVMIRAALSAAYPFLAAQAKADALAKVREVVAQHKGIDDWGVEYVYTRTLFEELEGKP